MRLCVFCGSRSGNDPAHSQAARALGALLARRGIGLVTGGGAVGLMGAVADAALAAGGEVIGVIPERLVRPEVAHSGLNELRVVSTMHQRKAEMASLADGFIALPGGIGTLEELFEVWTWAQLGYHAKPLGLLDTGGFFAPLVRFLDHQVAEGFLDQETRDKLVVEPEAAVLVGRLTSSTP